MVGLVATILATLFVVVMILLFERRRAEGIRTDLRRDLEEDRRQAGGSAAPGRPPTERTDLDGRDEGDDPPTGPSGRAHG